MVKPAVVLLVLAALAVGATVAGAVKSDDWTGERTYRFTAATLPMPDQDGQAAGSAPARFDVPAPRNATGMAATVDVTFVGQALQGGTAVVRIGGTAPDGTPLAAVTGTLAVPQGATTATASFEVNATWLELPGAVRDTRTPAGVTWERPLSLVVTVERPSDAPVASYSFTADVAGTFTAYASP